MAANKSDRAIYRRGVFKTGEITGGCRMPSDEGIAAQEDLCRRRAERGSTKLLRAMLRHGVRSGGVLSLTADQCHVRLDALSAVNPNPGAGAGLSR